MPSVDMDCTTHHFACQCREKKFEKIRNLLQEAIEIVMEGFSKFSTEELMDFIKRAKATLK